MKIQRTDVPITIPPSLIKQNVVKAVQMLNEAYQREYRRRIQIETRLDIAERKLKSVTEQRTST